MVDAASADGSSDQTLLEAAKALAALKGWAEQFNEMRHLRAAIAREEAKQDALKRERTTATSNGSGSSWRDMGVKAAARAVLGWVGTPGIPEWDNLRSAIAKDDANPIEDRAQQAESTAAWHKAESERLSQDLSDANAALVNVQRQARSLLDERDRLRQRAEKAEAELAVVKADCDTHRINAHEAAAAANCAPHDVAAEVLDLRQRAEKAEAEAARWKARADEAETAVASCWIAAAAMRERAEKAEEEIAHVRKALGAADGELTWMAAEKRVNMHHAAVGGCETLQGEYRTWRDRAEKAEAELAKARQDRQLDRAVDALTKIEPRDPTTGFTFATYRRLLEALGGKS